MVSYDTILRVVTAGEVVLIPQSWKDQVRSILENGYSPHVRLSESVFERWQSSFADYTTTTYNLIARVAEVLKDDTLKGVKITNMRLANGKTDPGEVWEFLFPRNENDKTKAYAKISLRLQNGVVYFYSAHKAERDYL